MKNSLLIVLSFLFILSSCKKDEESVLKIDENQSTLNVSITSATAPLNLTSNVTWTISSDQEWCTVSAYAGNGNKEIVVSCTDNYTGVDRAAKLTIEGGGLTQTVDVKQTGGTSLFTDDFSTNANHWGIITDTLTHVIIDGNFKLKNTCKVTSWSFSSRDIVPNTTDNFVVKIVFTRVSGTGGFGISIGGSDWDNLYLVVLNSNSFSAHIKTIGTYKSLISTTTCSLNTTSNTLRLVRMNGKCDIYINDVKVNSFDINPYGGTIGFYLAPQTEINVDYMKVTKI